MRGLDRAAIFVRKVSQPPQVPCRLSSAVEPPFNIHDESAPVPQEATDQRPSPATAERPAQWHGWREGRVVHRFDPVFVHGIL
jgi:hypothetical protein